MHNFARDLHRRLSVRHYNISTAYVRPNNVGAGVTGDTHNGSDVDSLKVHNNDGTVDDFGGFLGFSTDSTT